MFPRMNELVFMDSRWIKGGASLAPVQSPYPPEWRRIRRSRNCRETSEDMIAEQDCHGIDILSWFAGNAHGAARPDGH